MLTEALGDALRYSEQWRTRCAFMMIDLDRFKAVNDSLGHMVGDKLLAQVAARLSDLASETDLVGRLGGDEFAVVIRDASDKNVVAKVARKVIARLSQPYQVDQHTLYVGASVGSAVGPRDGQSVEELMRRLAQEFTIVIVTHNMQQAARVSDYTGFFCLGELVEFNHTATLFSTPHQEMTEAYITGRRGEWVT